MNQGAFFNMKHAKICNIFKAENNIKHVIKIPSKLILKNKGKAIPVTGCGGLWGCEMFPSLSRQSGHRWR
jgi:hypothetical protein